MRKIIRLTESDIKNIVSKIIKEGVFDTMNDPHAYKSHLYRKHSDSQTPYDNSNSPWVDRNWDAYRYDSWVGHDDLEDYHLNAEVPDQIRDAEIMKDYNDYEKARDKGHFDKWSFDNKTGKGGNPLRYPDANRNVRDGKGHLSMMAQGKYDTDDWDEMSRFAKGEHGIKGLKASEYFPESKTFVNSIIESVVKKINEIGDTPRGREMLGRAENRAEHVGDGKGDKVDYLNKYNHGDEASRNKRYPSKHGYNRDKARAYNISDMIHDKYRNWSDDERDDYLNGWSDEEKNFSKGWNKYITKNSSRF